MAIRLTHLMLVYHYSTSHGTYGWGNSDYATEATIPLSLSEIRKAEIFVRKSLPDCKKVVLTNYFILGQGEM